MEQMNTKISSPFLLSDLLPVSPIGSTQLEARWKGAIDVICRGHSLSGHKTSPRSGKWGQAENNQLSQSVKYC